MQCWFGFGASTTQLYGSPIAPSLLCVARQQPNSMDFQLHHLCFVQATKINIVSMTPLWPRAYTATLLTATGVVVPASWLLLLLVLLLPFFFRLGPYFLRFIARVTSSFLSRNA